MNIVCVFGNGFDLNLGLKTSYQDFYKYYLEQKSATGSSVEKLKEHIGLDIDNWSDLEISLGRHTVYLNSTDDVDDVFFDISEKLSDYLESEEDNFNHLKKDPLVFLADALSPQNRLTLRELDRFDDWKRSISSRVPESRKTKISVLTFNYTRTLERILGNVNSVDEALTSVASNTVFSGIDHVHGQIGETLIFGVNDISQIDNESLHASVEAMEVCIKPNHNEVLGHKVDVTCSNRIAQANLICIFGSSIGDTDKIWWERIGERLRDDCSLIIYVRSADVPLSRLVTTERVKRQVINDFLEKTALNDEEKENARGKMYVGINQRIFDIKN